MPAPGRRFRKLGRPLREEGRYTVGRFRLTAGVAGPQPCGFFQPQPWDFSPPGLDPAGFGFPDAGAATCAAVAGQPYDLCILRPPGLFSRTSVRLETLSCLRHIFLFASTSALLKTLARLPSVHLAMRRVTWLEPRTPHQPGAVLNRLLRLPATVRSTTGLHRRSTLRPRLPINLRLASSIDLQRRLPTQPPTLIGCQILRLALRSISSLRFRPTFQLNLLVNLSTFVSDRPSSSAFRTTCDLRRLPISGPPSD